MKHLLSFAAAFFILLHAATAIAQHPDQRGSTASLQFSTTSTTTASLPRFEPNLGQVADLEGNLLPEIEYMYQAPGMAMGLTKNGFIYNLYTVERQISEATGAVITPSSPQEDPERVFYHYHRVEVEFVGANPEPEIIAEDRTHSYANYYLSHCPQGVTGVYGFQKLTYKNLYPNIDLVLKRQQDEQGKEHIKYDIVVHPGGDLSQVKMTYKGMNGIRLEDGQLQVLTSQGSLTEHIPFSYWRESGEEVEVSYHLQKGTVTFDVNQNQAKQTLVVDPSLIWSTYLGGDHMDDSRAMELSGQNKVITSGWTWSHNFPTTAGAFQTTKQGFTAVFATEFTRSGSLNWSTYLGGSNSDAGEGLAIDIDGNLLITGYTSSPNFPTTSGTYQTSNGGGNDAFLVRLSPMGHLDWGTYIGGTADDYGFSVTTDGQGNPFICGHGESIDFPTTTGAYQEVLSGGRDAFLSKFTSTGSLCWSTLLGGTGEDRGWSAVSDKSGSIYIQGRTESNDFPVSSGAFQTTSGGLRDLFISKFTSNGSFRWSTYFGGSGNEGGTSLLVDSSGNVLCAGGTESSDFPITNGAYQMNLNGSSDAFLSKFAPNGTLGWSTFYGGSESDQGLAIAINGTNILIGGESSSSDFPVTNDAFQISFNGNDDGFISRFSPAGIPLWGTFVGGSGSDAVTNLESEDGDIYTSGVTSSSDFPVSGAIQNSFSGVGDIFLLRLGIGCTTTSSSINVSTCDNYSSPSGRYIWTASGTYTDTVPNSAGCDSIITVNLMLTRVETGVVQVGDTLTASGSNATYQWLDCNNSYTPINGATSRTFSPTVDGDYAVEVTENGCIDTSSCYPVIITGIVENEFEVALTVLPNPTSGKLTVNLGKRFHQITATIRSLSGQVISESTVHATEQIDIHIEEVAGVYLVQIETDTGESAVVKVVKQ